MCAVRRAPLSCFRGAPAPVCDPPPSPSCRLVVNDSIVFCAWVRLASRVFRVLPPVHGDHRLPVSAVSAVLGPLCLLALSNTLGPVASNTLGPVTVSQLQYYRMSNFVASDGRRPRSKTSGIAVEACGGAPRLTFLGTWPDRAAQTAGSYREASRPGHMNFAAEAAGSPVHLSLWKPKRSTNWVVARFAPGESLMRFVFSNHRTPSSRIPDL